MTPFIKKKEVKQNWYIIDAENAAVGRLAAYISKVLRGKNKATFNPHIDNGDFVVVTNIEKIKFTGKKNKDKKYYRHTGHPGGIKETSPLILREKNNLQNLKYIVVINILTMFKNQQLLILKNCIKKILLNKNGYSCGIKT